MKQIVSLILLLCLGIEARADTMTLNSGQVVKGRFIGFAERKFDFKTEEGGTVSEYPVNVKSIVPAAPLIVSVELTRTNYVNVEFRSFDEFTLHFAKDAVVLDERVILLKTLTVNRAHGRGKPGSADKNPPEREKMEEDPAPPPPREWQRSGKWREMDPKSNTIISKGEDVDIKDYLKKGSVNIVHFHYPKALASVREGNYIEALAAKSSNRLLILKVVVPDFQQPICESLGIKSLPQFWFYDAQGRLVKKLVDRFTEGDIDDALKLARRGAN